MRAHLKIYSNYFDEKGIIYDVISWDRTGDAASDELTYRHIAQYQESTWTRFREYFKVLILQLVMMTIIVEITRRIKFFKIPMGY